MNHILYNVNYKLTYGFLLISNDLVYEHVFKTFFDTCTFFSYDLYMYVVYILMIVIFQRTIFA